MGQVVAETRSSWTNARLPPRLVSPATKPRGVGAAGLPGCREGTALELGEVSCRTKDIRYLHLAVA